MSIRLMTQIWDNEDRELTGSRLVIMLCLADHANDQGVCWPSLTTLAKRARLDRSNVMDHIAALEQVGYITVERAINRSNTYTVHAAPSGVRATTPSGVRATTPSGVRATTPSGVRATTLVASAPPEPSLTTILTTTGTAAADKTRRPNPAGKVHQVKQLKGKSDKQENPPGGEASRTYLLTQTYSASAGRAASAKSTDLNSRVPAQVRTPLADKLLALTGQAALVNDSKDPDAGDRALNDAHKAAATLYELDFCSSADLVGLAAHWHANDWRGQRGDFPTFANLILLASQTRAREAAEAAPADPAARTIVAAPTADAFAALR